MQNQETVLTVRQSNALKELYNAIVRGTESGLFEVLGISAKMLDPATIEEAYFDDCESKKLK